MEKVREHDSRTVGEFPEKESMARRAGISEYDERSNLNRSLTMKIPLLLGLLAGVAAGSVLMAADKDKKNADAGRVEVVYTNPEKFTDLRDSEFPEDSGREGYLADLKEHLERRAPHYLAEGQKVTVTITDIDMAGEFEPWRGPRMQDVRIVKDIYPPRIKLSFQVTDTSGAVVKEGTRELRDLSFMMNVSINRDDPLRYEKNLLDDWMRSDLRAK
jgi:hypothetical protein